jgi:hypothetical protein
MVEKKSDNRFMAAPGCNMECCLFIFTRAKVHPNIQIIQPHDAWSAIVRRDKVLHVCDMAAALFNLLRPQRRWIWNTFARGQETEH